MLTNNIEYVDLAEVCFFSFLHHHPNTQFIFHCDEITMGYAIKKLSLCSGNAGVQFEKISNRSGLNWQEQKLEIILSLSGSSDLMLDADLRWNAALENTSPVAQSRVKFAGKLSESDLCMAYYAADTVVYPSLCEGFGRVCLEAMEAGTPIACSDLPVMREVAGGYACWFDPFDNLSIVAAIEKALSEKRKEVVRDERFQAKAVKASFLDAMDRVTSQN
jgi:glycosyltransferase involved in cell wall biosynthesis